jgi:hypothetical protein
MRTGEIGRTLPAMAAFKPKSEVPWNGAAAQAGRQLHNHLRGKFRTGRSTAQRPGVLGHVILGPPEEECLPP